jgi:tetratricopeptide (TPR) repeat protein
MFRDAVRLSPDIVTAGNLNHEYGNLLQEAGEPEEARRIFHLMLTDKPEERSRGLRSIALFEMGGGHFDTSTTLLREAIVQTRIMNAPVSEYRNRLFLAVALQHLGRRDAAHAQLDTAYHLFQRTYLEPWLLTYGGRLFIRDGNVQRGKELRDSLVARMTAGSADDLTARDVLEAEVTRAERHPEQAASALEIAYGRTSKSPYVLESLAEALADRGDLDGASARYQELMTNRTLGWEGQDGGVMAPFRLGQIAEAKSDTAAALRWYNQFLDRWKTGDSGIVEMIQARRRVAALSGPG